MTHTRFAINAIPRDVLSLVLAAVGKDAEFLVRLVCCAWRDTIKVSATRTPLSVVVVSVPVLQWARANGCPWNWRTCACAASGGHLEVLQWMRVKGCKWDWHMCQSAAKRGHLHVLQWALANGCQYDQRWWSSAAQSGHLAVLQWAHAQGYSWDCWAVLEDATLHGHIDVCEWASTHCREHWACTHSYDS